MKKKRILSLVFFAGALCGQVFAEGDVSTRLSQLEKEMAEISVKNAMGTVGARLAPMNNSEHGWYGEVDVLLWHAKSGGVDWALVFNQANLPMHGRMKTLGFDWDWGVRVGLGKLFQKDGWDLNFLYTYFGTDDSSHVNNNFVTYDSITATNAIGSTRGGYSGKITYNAIDANIGKPYFVSKSLSFHPYAGLKAVWLDQKYKLTTNNTIDASQTSIPVAGIMNTDLRDKSNLFGIGPALGLDANWHLCHGFKILGAMSGALLQGYNRVTQHETFSITPTGDVTTNTSLDLIGSLHRLFPHARLLLGLGWADYLKNKKQRLDISLNYETNYFWRVNQTLNELGSDPADLAFNSTQTVRLNIDRLSEDLAFYGVTLKIRLDF